MIAQAGEKSKANTKKICVVQRFGSGNDACCAYGKPVQGQGLQCSGCSQDGLYQGIESRSAAAVQIKSEGDAYFYFFVFVPAGEAIAEALSNNRRIWLETKAFSIRKRKK